MMLSFEGEAELVDYLVSNPVILVKAQKRLTPKQIFDAVIAEDPKAKDALSKAGVLKLFNGR